ncbi:MAG: hypothetical protein L0Y38_01080 [Methylococcaceae bacterium]|nr:hypothetical protein [Methylococcaceae bacterium]MCI0732398.1 hypothetical protein [Methylococcaceae bacterium]
MKNQIQSWQMILRRLLFVNTLIVGVLAAPSVWAHGGASVKIDSCRIPVIANHWVHFTAYTPTLTADTEYCESIPEIGPTNLVFDYENKRLRNLSVQFEITKEPEGDQIYYQPPEVQKTGTVNAAIDFSQFGEGDYLAHVSLINEGKKIDAHLPFSVGGGGGTSVAALTGGLFAILGLVAVIYGVPALRGRFAEARERVRQIEAKGLKKLKRRLQIASHRIIG